MYKCNYTIFIHHQRRPCNYRENKATRYGKLILFKTVPKNKKVIFHDPFLISVSFFLSPSTSRLLFGIFCSFCQSTRFCTLIHCAEAKSLLSSLILSSTHLPAYSSIYPALPWIEVSQVVETKTAASFSVKIAFLTSQHLHTAYCHRAQPSSSHPHSVSDNWPT